MIADGLKPESMTGATDHQIDAFANEQGVRDVPAAFRQVLRLIGVRRGLWFAGTAFGIGSIDGASKREALATLSRFTDPFTDSAGLLVLADHQAYQYYVIDGACLTEPDPAVWIISETDGVEQCWPSVTSWFDSADPDVGRYVKRMQMLRDHGKQSKLTFSEFLNLEPDDRGTSQ
ncbi:SMI1/KNR4 family protein [Nocardia sp. NPDC059240]|uniref:SMI1/KNR4 family protein n=1 Tax=Nocardia sp. NPDC059240 TaxID=3346786 RepID=UPI00367EABB3